MPKLILYHVPKSGEIENFHRLNFDLISYKDSSKDALNRIYQQKLLEG